MRVPSGRRPAIVAVCGVVVAVLAAGCTQAVPGRAGAAPQPPLAAVSAAGPAADPLPADVVEVGTAATAALQDVWREAFPAAFGRPWRDIRTFAPVDTDDGGADVPPCVNRSADVTDQAFYCPAADAVVWDARNLAPELHRRFDAAGIVVVLAHEVGHAVQTRLGLDDAQARDPQRYPTILLEAMADCYAGVALAQLAERPVAGLPIGPVERDAALLALVGFRDPIGLEPGDGSAHGNAFDRVSAFQDGHRDGPVRCAAMSLDNREFTQRRFGSDADRARGGDLPLPQLLTAVERDASAWVATLAPELRMPPIRGRPGCTARGLAPQGPARFCAADDTVSVDQAQLADLHRELGDYAGATVVASRYALAVLRARGVDPSGPAAGAAAVCLAGAYTGRLLDPDGGFTLSPGDLDEAVAVLLAGDWAARADGGEADPAEHGFERVARFRTGLLDGPDVCFPS